MIICGVTLLALQIFLSQTFEMNDLGKLNYFPGLKVFSSINGYYLSQVKYSFNLLFIPGLTHNKIRVGSRSKPKAITYSKNLKRSQDPPLHNQNAPKLYKNIQKLIG